MKQPTNILVETYRFQNRFRLMCNALALLDCTLTNIEPEVHYGFHRPSHFDRAIKSSVPTLGVKRLKEITSLQRKVGTWFP